MVPNLDPLPITLSHDAPAERDRALLNDAACIAKDWDTRVGTNRVAELVTSNGEIASTFLDAVSPHITKDRPSFCEWGSGIGVVTCLAHRRGWTATGIEIEPRLVAQARSLAAKHEIGATFHEGSYKPDRFFTCDTEKVDFGTGLGFDLFGFDIIYAYVWPTESHALTSAIAQHAPNGTIFMRYGGGIQCDAFRVRRDA